LVVKTYKLKNILFKSYYKKMDVIIELDEIPDWIKIKTVNDINELIFIAKNSNSLLHTSKYTIRDSKGDRYFYAYYLGSDDGYSKPLAVSIQRYFDTNYFDDCISSGSIICGCGKGNYNSVYKNYTNLLECDKCGYAFEDFMYFCYGEEDQFK
jgi:hypothetical protein